MTEAEYAPWVYDHPVDYFLRGVYAIDRMPAANRWATAGAVLSGFMRDMYFRIYADPASLALGNLAGEQRRDVTIWNAWPTRAVTLDSVELVNGDGVSVLAPGEPPLVFAPMQERTWEVSVAIDGAPVVDAQLVFDFTEAVVSVAITGNRITPWLLVPDWAEGILERLQWLTDVLQANTQHEQRRKIRLSPRRTFEAPFLAEGAERSRAELALLNWGARRWAMPVWPDVQLLTLAVASGATAISAVTTWRDFRDGGLVLLRGEAAFEYEVAEVLEVTPGYLQLKNPVTRDWPVGTRLYPVRVAELQRQPSIRRLSNRASEIRAEFITREACDWPELPPGTTYKGAPVLLQPIDEGEQLEQTPERSIEVLDNETGAVSITDLARQAFVTPPHRTVMFGAQERGQYRGLLYWLAGRFRAMWVPTYAEDLRLVAESTGLSSTIDVENVGYSIHGTGQISRSHVDILLRSGSHLFREVIAATELSADVERLVLDSALGVAIAPADVVRISFMALCRQTSDQVEIQHETDVEGAAVSVQQFRGVRDVA